MAKITDVKEIPSEMLKADTFDIYKAYFFDNTKEDDYKMQINENVDMFGITPEAAVNELLRTVPSEIFVAQMNAEFDEMVGIDPEKKWIYDNMVVTVDGKVKDNDLCTVEMTNIVVPILTIRIDMDDLKEKELIEDGKEVVFHDDVIGITLSDKKYEMFCTMHQLVSFKIMINADGSRQITDISLKEIDGPHKKGD